MTFQSMPHTSNDYTGNLPVDDKLKSDSSSPHPIAKPRKVGIIHNM